MKKFNLLIFVDDDHPTNVYHRIVLEESNLSQSHHFFLSSQKALDFLESLSLQSEPVYPDIIFLDINMPGINGWEFIEHLQQFDIPKTPAVIMLTTSLYYRDMERVKENPHIYQVITKPLEKEHIQQLSKELLHEG